MTFRPGDHVFVDESKARGYRLAAVAVSATEVGPVEKRLRSLKGSRSVIHFNDEAARRETLLKEFLTLPFTATIYLMRGASDRVARPALLRRLTEDMVSAHARRLTLESDESLVHSDRRALHQRLEQLGARDRMTYVHHTSRDQPLLWLADAVGWCDQKGGVWRARVQPVIAAVVELDAP